MNLVPLLAPWQWALLAAVPVGIVLLYFLKLRRQPVRVPSTYLWSRTVEDLHVNSLMQRLRRNLLLFLQLLFILLIALALLRPGWRGTSEGGRRLVMLLDASASMQATDVEGADSRFEEARERVGRQIDAMDDTDVAMLIAFSDRADVLQSFTSDRRRLREALATAEVTHRSTDLIEALRAAAGLANPGRTSQTGDVMDIQVAEAQPADLLIFSDGAFGAINEFNLGNLHPLYIPIGSTTPQNLAIVAFSADRSLEDPDTAQIFARITNLGAVRARGEVLLELDGQLLDAAAVDLEPDEESGLSFEIRDVETGVLRLRLEAADDLAVDNVAYAALAAPRRAAVLLVSPGNRTLELAFETEQASQLARLEVVTPEYLESDEYASRAEASRDDLIIFDRCAPPRMPRASTMFIGSMPTVGWEAGETESPVLLIDIDRTHPLMRFLELFSLRIVQGHALEPPPTSATLLTAESGPVMAIAPRDGYQDLVLGFEILSTGEEGGSEFNTDWPIQRSWPVFVLNVLRHLAGGVETAAAVSYPPGTTVAMRVDSRLTEVRVEGPDGSGVSERVSVGAGGQVAIASTDALGLYRLTDAQQNTLGLFTINLFDPAESRLARADSIELGYEEIAGAAPTEIARRELWRWLLLGALGLLAAEWLLFNRRLL